MALHATESVQEYARGYVNGEVFEDTRDRKKPIVYLYGSRPFTAGLCLGVEKALQGMKAGKPYWLAVFMHGIPALPLHIAHVYTCNPRTGIVPLQRMLNA